MSGTITIPACRRIVSVSNAGASISNDCITSWQKTSDTQLYYNKSGSNYTHIQILYLPPL